jgi:photosystem II stability/assembly factor-like uncharacterized protein
VTGSPGTILATHDGGKTWRNQESAASGTNADLDAVTCADAAHCVTVGWGCQGASGCTVEGFVGVILVTVNGGKTWGDRDQRITVPIRGGGTLCGSQPVCHTSVSFNGVSCAGADRCWVVGGTGTLLRSDDGGRSWHKEAKATDMGFTDVACPTVYGCYAIGPGGAILRFDMSTGGYGTVRKAHRSDSRSPH